MVTNEEWIESKKEQILNDIRRRMPERYPAFGLLPYEDQDVGSFAWEWKQKEGAKFEDLEFSRKLTWFIRTRIYYRPDPSQTILENKFTKYIKEQLKPLLPPPPVPVPKDVLDRIERLEGLIVDSKKTIKEYEDQIANILAKKAEDRTAEDDAKLLRLDGYVRSENEGIRKFEGEIGRLKKTWNIL